MSNDQETCASCKFFKDAYEYDKERGDCRRYPPVNVANIYQNQGEIVTDINAEYPFIKRDGWCGEWKK